MGYVPGDSVSPSDAILIPDLICPCQPMYKTRARDPIHMRPPVPLIHADLASPPPLRLRKIGG